MTLHTNIRGWHLLLPAALTLGPLALVAPLTAQTPTPLPTARPLPTRRPTPVPRVTPIPIASRGGYPVNHLMLEGFVSGKPGRGDFFFRANGNVYRVKPYNVDLLTQIAGGDAIRVFGTADGLVINNANVRTLRSRASNSPDDYSPGNATDNRGRGTIIDTP